MSETTFTPTPDRQRDYREALGCYGTGVTVVTTLDQGRPVAMTANSFASVSLDPPLVLWCPARASLRHDSFVQADRYAIHVMREDQQEMAVHFARSGLDFDGIDWREGADGVPVLPGCLARFDCARVQVQEAGDHSIILGRVLEASYRPGKGLMFKRGQYGGFSDFL